MITFRTFLTLPETQVSYISTSYQFSSTTVQDSQIGVSTSQESTSFHRSTEFSSTANTSTTNHSSRTTSFQENSAYHSRTDNVVGGSGITRQSGGSTVSSTRNLSSSGATTTTGSTLHFTNSDFAAGTSSSSNGTTTGTTTAGLTGTTSTGISLISTTILGSLSRNYTSTYSTSSQYTYVSIESASSTTVSTSSTSSIYQTTTASHSTTFSGYSVTTTSNVTVTRDFLGNLLSYTANVIMPLDFSSINEWMFVPSATSSLYRLVTDVAASATSALVGTIGTSGQSRHTSACSFVSFTCSVLRESTDAAVTSTYSTSSTLNVVSGTTLTYHITSVTATRTYTTLTYYSTLPFPGTSSGTLTENDITLTTTTITAQFISSSTTSSLFGTVNNIGDGANFFGAGTTRAIPTTTLNTTEVVSTQTISTLLTYHSSQRSVVTATTIGSTTVTFSQSSTASASFVYANEAYSALTNVSNGTSSQTASQSFSRSSAETRSFITWRGFSGLLGVIDTKFGALQFSLMPRMLTGFRNVGAAAYSDTYGTSIAVNINGSTRIPFPVISFEQKHSVYLPVAISTSLFAETGDILWSLSFNSNSILATYSDQASSTSTTVTATWTVQGSTSDSTSYVSTAFPVKTSATLSTRTATNNCQGFGGYADVSTVGEGLIIAKGAYLETVRPVSGGGADTTATTSMDCAASRFSSAVTSNLNILDAISVVRPTQNGPFPYVTTAKWVY